MTSKMVAAASGALVGAAIATVGGFLAEAPVVGWMFYLLGVDWSAPDAFPYGIYVVMWGIVAGAAMGLFWLDASRELARDA